MRSGGMDGTELTILGIHGRGLGLSDIIKPPSVSIKDACVCQPSPSPHCPAKA